MSSVVLARLLIDDLIASGVTDAVVAPGSRNAPLSFALSAADREGRLRLHVRIDERDAGFLALGLAKATGRPVPVVTTSGTAVANLTPAVWEAHHSAVPLLVISADRPLGMADAGANQTTRHDGAFAGFVRAAARVESSDPRALGSARHQLRRLLARACGAVGADPGPVHLNVGLAEPLVPGVGDQDAPAPARSRSGDAPWQGSAPGHPATADSGHPVTVPAGPRTVLLVGDARPEVGRQAHAAARAARIPVLAEPSSNARLAGSISTYRLLLGTALGDRIERVVLVGHPTLSRPINTLIGRDDIELVVVNEAGDWVDPGHRASQVVAAITWEPGDPTWDEQWQQAEQRLATRVGDLLAGQPLTGLDLAALSVRHSTGNLVLGASQLIRDADLAPIAEHPADVYANRGLAGIDGTISTAIGIALGTGLPTTVLLGDVTAAHDVGGLLIGPDEPRPDVRVVLGNDDGGAIFHALEQGDPAHAETFERVFGTPHGVDFAALARAYHWHHRRADTRQDLEAALSVAPQGLELVEVPLRRSGRRDLGQQINRLADDGLGQ